MKSMTYSAKLSILRKNNYIVIEIIPEYAMSFKYFLKKLLWHKKWLSVLTKRIQIFKIYFKVI